jgi:predicted deacetylase
MFAKYILRLDDAHPRMDHEKWNAIQDICIKYNIKPIVAMIPDNQDRNIDFSDVDCNFWKKASLWMQSDWTIAMHGYQHLLRKSSKGLIPVNDYSEFIGLDKTTQADLIKKGLSIFKLHDIKPVLWVAPAHGLDINTINALLENSLIRIISDGFSFRPYTKYDAYWIPQQLWKGRNMLFGMWTICLHPSSMSDKEIEEILKFIIKNKENFVSVRNLNFTKFNVLDFLFEKLFLFLLKIKKC